MKSLPTLYRHFDKDGNLLYVGVSLCVLRRHVAHQSGSDWYGQVATITLERFATPALMVEAEQRAIREEKPIINISGALNPDGSRKRSPLESPPRVKGAARVITQDEQEIRDRLEKAREIRGELARIAKESGVTYRTLLNIRRGELETSIGTIRLLSDFFKKEARRAAKEDKEEVKA